MPCVPKNITDRLEPPPARVAAPAPSAPSVPDIEPVVAPPAPMGTTRRIYRGGPRTLSPLSQKALAKRNADPEHQVSAEDRRGP
jgi:hypothetical protein